MQLRLTFNTVGPTNTSKKYHYLFPKLTITVCQILYKYYIKSLSIFPSFSSTFQ